MILFGIHPRPCGAAVPMDVVLCYESIEMRDGIQIGYGCFPENHVMRSSMMQVRLYAPEWSPPESSVQEQECRHQVQQRSPAGQLPEMRNFFLHTEPFTPSYAVKQQSLSRLHKPHPPPAIQSMSCPRPLSENSGQGTMPSRSTSRSWQYVHTLALLSYAQACNPPPEAGSDSCPIRCCT